jgi:hypothetical protein
MLYRVESDGFPQRRARETCPQAAERKRLSRRAHCAAPFISLWGCLAPQQSGMKQYRVQCGKVCRTAAQPASSTPKTPKHTQHQMPQTTQNIQQVPARCARAWQQRTPHQAPKAKIQGRRNPPKQRRQRLQLNIGHGNCWPETVCTGFRACRTAAGTRPPMRDVVQPAESRQSGMQQQQHTHGNDIH